MCDYYACGVTVYGVSGASFHLAIREEIQKPVQVQVQVSPQQGIHKDYSVPRQLDSPNAPSQEEI